MTAKILLGAAMLSLAACSNAPPPSQQQQQGDPALLAPPAADVDASRPAGNADLVPIAPPTPPGQESKKPLRPLPANPGPDTMLAPGPLRSTGVTSDDPAWHGVTAINDQREGVA